MSQNTLKVILWENITESYMQNTQWVSSNQASVASTTLSNSTVETSPIIKEESITPSSPAQAPTTPIVQTSAPQVSQSLNLDIWASQPETKQEPEKPASSESESNIWQSIL